MSALTVRDADLQAVLVLCPDDELITNTLYIFRPGAIKFEIVLDKCRNSHV